MEFAKFAPGETIFAQGEPIHKILIISAGEVLGTSEKGELFLKKGDIPGVFDLSCGYSFYTYTASEPVTCLCYPLPEEGLSAEFFNAHKELNDLFSVSACGQCCSILDDSILQRYHCDSFYQSIREYYREYEDLCHKYGVMPKQLPDIEEFVPFHTDEAPPDYLGTYYETMREMPPEMRAKLFHDSPAFTYGFLQKVSDDVHRVFEYLQSISDYQADNSFVLLNQNGIDLFELYTSLCLQLMRKHEDTISVTSTIGKLLIQMEGLSCIDQELYRSRTGAYRTQLENQSALLEESGDEQEEETLPTTLTDSAHIILSYCEYPAENANAFLKDLHTYCRMTDRSAQTDDASALRKRLTKVFYELYTEAFTRSTLQKESALPPAVRLFLYFGYIDEELAGQENTTSLLHIAENIPDDPSRGVYTLYHWLLAIYLGQKEPSRNEFDNDYSQYLHEQRIAGKIDVQTERRLLNDPQERVLYELQNMFPVVNKSTCGRITTFCPFFSEHNCLRTPEDMLVNADKLQTALNAVRAIDYSVFYREVLFSLPECGITHETIQVEVLPDIILMPNIGTRGVLWQEIEGKRRTTPSRMLFSFLCQEDISLLVTRLCGEFRWEMCKRMQGAHWNNISELSLTSEYFDYIQFYRKNKDLSPDTKEKIKISLQRAKNSYREMFVRDYIQWVMFESAGSPRLNKLSRKILFRYCPFSANLRKKLEVNPIYRELLDKQSILIAKEQHHLSNVIQKIQKTGRPIPPELTAQQEFLLM